MKRVVVLNVLNKDHRPRYTSIQIANQFNTFEIYKPGAGRSISEINKTKANISAVISKVLTSNNELITSDFRYLLDNFNITELDSYNAYDIHLPDLITANDDQADINKLKLLSQKLMSYNHLPYQKLISNVSTIYKKLQQSGLYHNYKKVTPVWSVKTFSGRSKSSGFNIQGFYDNDMIRPSDMDGDVVLAHFDWIGADIRIAGLLANDEVLNSSFSDSDPYLHMMQTVNNGIENDGESGLSRDECKNYILKSINSMDYEGNALSSIYPKLVDWLRFLDNDISRTGKSSSILGRKFTISDDRGKLAILNGIMQGSVAHGMHNVLCRLWPKLGLKIIADIHDSLVVACYRQELEQLIEMVVDIMKYPFDGLLPNNPIFPVKVSVGNLWKEWEFKQIVR